jgi:hypothetical protein
LALADWLFRGWLSTGWLFTDWLFTDLLSTDFGHGLHGLGIASPAARNDMGLFRLARNDRGLVG